MSAGHSVFGRGLFRAANLVVLVASLVGLAGFFFPFVLPVVQDANENAARAGEAPLLLAGVTALCLLAMALEFDAGATGSTSKTVALLGVLVAIDATLRLAPSLLGASPIFLLIIFVGSVFGSALGFQMGMLTLLVSAFLTGGVGPWLPYEMLGAGWVGLAAGWLPRPASPRLRIALLAGFGGISGLLYGGLLNLWFWPVTAPGVGAESSLYWAPGLSVAETFERYLHFYVVTSLGYDLFRAAGNIALIVILGAPLLAVLERFRSRFTWQPWVELELAETEA